QWNANYLGRLRLPCFGTRLGLAGAYRRHLLAGRCGPRTRAGRAFGPRIAALGASPGGCFALARHESPFLPTFSNALSRTLALRGLRSISAAEAFSAPRVKATNSGSCPGSSTGRPLGVRDAVARAKTSLTIRSS